MGRGSICGSRISLSRLSRPPRASADLKTFIRRFLPAGPYVRFRRRTVGRHRPAVQGLHTSGSESVSCGFVIWVNLQDQISSSQSVILPDTYVVLGNPQSVIDSDRLL